MLSAFHPMKVGVLSETLPGERRVALIPDVAGKLTKSGFEVVLEAGAGERADFIDEAYRRVGVSIEVDRWALLSTDRKSVV